MSTEEVAGSDLMAGGKRCSGRSALRRRTLSARLASAPVSSSSCTTSPWPYCDAIRSPVVPSCSEQRCVLKNACMNTRARVCFQVCACMQLHPRLRLPALVEESKKAIALAAGGPASPRRKPFSGAAAASPPRGLLTRKCVGLGVEVCGGGPGYN